MLFELASRTQVTMKTRCCLSLLLIVHVLDDGELKPLSVRYNFYKLGLTMSKNSVLKWNAVQPCCGDSLGRICFIFSH